MLFARVSAPRQAVHGLFGLALRIGPRAVETSLSPTQRLTLAVPLTPEDVGRGDWTDVALRVEGGSAALVDLEHLVLLPARDVTSELRRGSVTLGGGD